MSYYVLDDNNNKAEATDYQGILSLLEQAIEDGSLENITKDSAFVSKLKCCVGGGTHQVAFVTQAKYNELAAANQLIQNAIYFITDDTTCNDIDVELANIKTRLDSLGFNVGAFIVPSGSAPTVNTIKKCGKYVIASYTGDFAEGNVTVPQQFRPKVDTVCSAYGVNENFKTIKSITVKTNGTIVLESGTAGTIVANNIGWEIN